MTFLGSLVALGWLVWRGAAWPAVIPVVLGVAIQATLVVRLASASAGGVGGHAEWVRETSRRPRIVRSRAWAVGVGLVLLGVGASLLH